MNGVAKGALRSFEEQPIATAALIRAAHEIAGTIGKKEP
jgi:hypothetical protein